MRKKLKLIAMLRVTEKYFENGEGTKRIHADKGEGEEVDRESASFSFN